MRFKQWLSLADIYQWTTIGANNFSPFMVALIRRLLAPVTFLVSLGEQLKALYEKASSDSFSVRSSPSALSSSWSGR